MLSNYTKSRWAIIGIHSGIWLVFIFILSTLIYLFQDEKQNSLGVLFLQGISGIGLIVIPTIYYNTALLIPRFLIQKKYVRYILSIFVFSCVWGTIGIYLEQWMDQHIFLDEPEPIDKIYPGILIVIFLFLASTLVHLSYRWFLQQNKITKIQNDRLNIELSLLRSQINPHFFFNTLNNLYSLSLEQSSKTSGVILKLSEMMRYAIYECKADQVTIKQEIKYLENYISLQQIRLENRGNIEFSREVENEEAQIAPMLFIVLLENAFKHGIEKMTEGAYVKLDLNVEKQVVVFLIENNYEEGSSEEKGLPGVGLANIQRRLALIYPDKYQLELTDSQGVFKVVLKISLN